MAAGINNHRQHDPPCSTGFRKMRFSCVSATTAPNCQDIIASVLIFAPFLLINLRRDLRPLGDRLRLIRLRSNSSASQILLSATVIYDTISGGGLDWLRSLPPACQGCGRKCRCYHQTSHSERTLTLSLSAILSYKLLLA